MIVIGAFILNAIHLSTYAITPGNAEPVGPLIHVRGIETEPHNDKIMLTDVYINQLTALTWITTHFQSHVQYISEQDVVSPGIPTSQINDQGYIDMDQSKMSAKVAALTALGWKIPATPAGAIVYGVPTGTPAAKAGLGVGDEIVKVNSSPVTDQCDLIALVRDHAPGTTVALGVKVATISSSGTVVLSAPRTIAATLVAPPSSTPPPPCPGVSGPATSYLGIQSEDAVDYTFPGTIAISTPDIGGPSAGLAMTLGLIDRLSGGSLTDHTPIAATGTIDPAGDVGDVGGVAEKTVAVEREGARIFFVPEQEATVAKDASNGQIKVIPVSSLAQALSDLERMGGTAPTPLTKPYPLRAAT